MQNTVPLEINFKGPGYHKEEFETEITKRAERLGKLHPGIMRCRVVVEAPHGHKRQGVPYRVRIELSLSQKKIVVSRERRERRAHEGVEVVVHEAFDAAARQLEEFAARQHREVKAHEAPPHGTVSALFPDEDYGFITASDGSELYFHRNSVLNDAFDKLHVGSEVRFTPEQGEKGPQASTVRAVGRRSMQD